MPVNPELLIPAGDFEKMRYAFAYGADAVYLGVPQFSLRTRENGFRTLEQVAQAVEYGHRLGKKVYVTANILPHNHKVGTFQKFAANLLAACRPDAWIMSDPGLIMFIRERYPKEAIHLSVQANTVNYQSARFWQKIGISRIILSRELSIREMAEFHSQCPGLELEAFVHGAICIAYSGRCLISNYLSYRDPNQGTCSHSCRWEYKVLEKKDLQPPGWKEGIDPKTLAETAQGDPYVPLPGDYYLEESERPGEYLPIDEDEHGTYLMNSRDLCAIEYLKELHEAGIISFKVEGRSKSVYYTAMITRAYRRAIDNMLAGKPFDPPLMEDIFATANRGLIAGFLKGNPGHTAQQFEEGRSENSSHRFSGILRAYDAQRKLMKVELRNPIHRGMNLEMIRPDRNEIVSDVEVFDKDMHPVDTAHGGAGHCYIPYDSDPGEFVLFRERLPVPGPKEQGLNADAQVQEMREGF